MHALSERATEAFEAARDTVQRFLNAADRKEIIFTRGTTEAINLVAQSYARTVLNLGDEIVISAMEHHSNIVPWQMVCRERGAVLRVVPIERRRRAAARRVREAARPAHPAGRDRARLQRARHDQSGARRSSSWRIATASRC